MSPGRWQPFRIIRHGAPAWGANRSMYATRISIKKKILCALFCCRGRGWSYFYKNGHPHFRRSCGCPRRPSHLLEEPVIELVVCLLATQLLQGEKMEPHEREVPAGDHLESGIVSYEFLEGSCHADMGADVVLGASKQPNIYGYMLSRFQLL